MRQLCERVGRRETLFERKSHGGRFVVRLPPEVHRELTIEAAESGVSLNRLINARLSQ